MSFRPYDHVERLGHPDVEGIDIGTVYVFPKLDGTNSSVWLGDDGELHTGSRRRELEEGADNRGFRAWVESRAPVFLMFFKHRPYWTLYGEWLVPHTLKTYRNDAWRRFYVFDVYDRATRRYVPFTEYAPVLELEEVGLEVIHPLYVATNPTAKQLQLWLSANTYLIKDGAGAGEGIVLKNYGWRNQYGRQPWAKLVRAEFRRRKQTSTKEGIESIAVGELLTEEMVRKTLASVADMDRVRIIPRLLETVYHDFVVEETWTILKRWKGHQTIDFRQLKAHVVERVKQLVPELF